MLCSFAKNGICRVLSPGKILFKFPHPHKQSNIKRPKKIRRKTKYKPQTQKFGGGVPSFLPTHIYSEKKSQKGQKGKLRT
jgi:hypothetical protein